MNSPTAQVQFQTRNEGDHANPPSQAGFHPSIDWRETCWFLKREDDELAGYLFTDDFDLREDPTEDPGQK
jgi:hypothetical protein